MPLGSCGLTCVVFVLMICTMTTTKVIENVIPDSWESLCTRETDSNILELYVKDVIAKNNVTHVQCHVTKEAGNSWRFNTLQDHLRHVHDVTVFLRVECTDDGRLSLPWPMKANGLVGLIVTNCLLTNKYADLGNPRISQIPDQLRVLEIRNSVWLSEWSELTNITDTEDLANLDSDYDCGHDSTIECLVISNVSFAFFHTAGITTTLDLSPGSTTSSPSEKQNDQHLRKFQSTGSQNTNPNSSGQKIREKYNSAENVDIHTLGSGKDNINPEIYNINNITLDDNAAESVDDFKSLLQKLLSLDIKCRFDKLKLIDESNPQVMPIQHFQVMVHSASYPQLRIMNYSGSGITELPQELQDFREHFPKLQYLDLSRNYLKEIHLLRSPEVARGTSLTLDVRNNLITDVSFKDVLAWSKVDDVVVDIRNNPIHCGCHMMNLLRRIQTETTSVGHLQKYKYIEHLECATPNQFKGQTLTQVGTYCDNKNHFSASSTEAQTTDISRSARLIILAIVAVVIILLAPMIVVVAARKLSLQEKGRNCANNSFGETEKDKDVETGVYV